MKMRWSSVFITVLFCFFFFTQTNAQTITHGPVIGGVTENSARILIRTAVPFSYQLEIADNTFFQESKIIHGQTSQQNYLFHIADITDLNPDTRYYYRIIIGGNIVEGPNHFYTFPCPGQATNFSFHFGSCMNNNVGNDVLFDVMQQYEPRFFLHLGDWLYPDTTENLPDNTDFYSLDYDLVVGAYKGRYSYPRMRNYLRNVPMSYVYDDHDYVADNTSRTTASYTNVGLTATLMEIPFPPIARRNLIEAYYRFFPAYPEVDTTEGIFHSFRFGNTEIFMIDNRSARSPNTHSIKNVNGNWVFDPDPDHTLLGDVQREWLLDGLKNSTATWKFIASGTAFNRTYGDALQTALNLPNLAGLPIAALLVDSWSGFPLDQDTLINWVQQHQIDGVIMMSGDTHTSAIGDAQTGGLTEMMAGCLSQSNSTLYTTVPLLNMGLQWSEGGQGIDGNLNTNNAFGNVEVFGDDSVRLTLIDEENTVLATYTIYSCSFTSGLQVQVDSVEHLLCADTPDGKVHLNLVGGTPPYQFFVNDEAWGNDPVLKNLDAGRHLISIRDATGCSIEACVTLDAPPLFEVEETFQPASCIENADGSLALDVKGGIAPYAIEWSEGISGYQVEGLQKGIYAYTLTDQNGCTITSQIEIDAPDTLKMKPSTFSPNCHGEASGRIFSNVSGGTKPYQYEWSGGQGGANLVNIPAGTYDVTVTDSNGCQTGGKFTLVEPDEIEAEVIKNLPGDGEANGRIEIETTGGIAPYQFEWNTGDNGSVLEDLPAGFYQVVITDSRGCKKTVDIYLPVGTAVSEIYASGLQWYAFPNPAETFIHIAFNTNQSMPVEVEIFNVSGSRMYTENVQADDNVYHSVDISEWPSGVYLIRLKTADGQSAERFIRL